MEEIKLGSNVIIEVSSEEGTVVGIAHYQTYTQYYIRYKAADGRAVEAWWDEGAVILTS